MPAPLSQARLIQLTAAAVAVLGTLVSCTGRDYQPTAIVKDGVVVSVRDQKMAVMRGGKVVKTYPSAPPNSVSATAREAAALRWARTGLPPR